MPKSGGEITRNRILEVAEKLFSEKGYDATSMDMVSRYAEINKATIYYHFKDKTDILHSLFAKIISELEARLSEGVESEEPVREKVKKEIIFLRSKRDILSVLVMEQLKGKDGSNSLFQIGKFVIDAEIPDQDNIKMKYNHDLKQKYYIHEFFTGLIPVIMFVIFEDKWTEYFNCRRNTLLDDFVEQYEITHLRTHIL